jgi:hypothetical protein
MRINMARAAALMHPPVTIGDLELEAQYHSVVKIAALRPWQLGRRRKSRRAVGKASLVLVAWPCLRVLLF